MRKYIILARSIVNIGGEEIYNRNKARFLKELGYDVIIVSTARGKVVIDDLLEYYNYVIEELSNEPCYYNEKQISKILNKIKNIIGNTLGYEDIIFESHTPKLSIWGEFIAKEVGGRNFCLLSDDRFPVLSKDAARFFEFKFNRHELAGISDKSLQMLFGDYLEIPGDKKYHLSFACINSIEPTMKNLGVNKDDYDIIIGTITRLEKVCVPVILDNVKKFAENNQNKKILFLYFGGASDSRVEKKTIKYMTGLKNLSFIITGNIFPIPQEDVEKVDLFINLAGAAHATRRLAIPTLSIELETGIPLGLLGITTQFAQYREVDNNCNWNSICEALDNIFVKKQPDIIEVKSLLKLDPHKMNFEPHEKFIEEGMKSVNEYFDFSDYKVSKIWYILISGLYSTVGIKNLKKIMNLYRKIFR